MDIHLVQGPGADAALDVVSLDQMKKHLRIFHDKLDDEIEDAIRDAVDFFDGRHGVLNRSVLPATWVLYLDRFVRSEPIFLPYPDLQEITSIVYFDRGEEITLDEDAFSIEQGRMVGTVVPLSKSGWPVVAKNSRAIAITYKAGYSTIPHLLKRGVKILAAHYFRNPEATRSDNRDSRSSHAIEYGIDQIVLSLRVPLSFGEPV